jgi:hypothetical protein
LFSDEDGCWLWWWWFLFYYE